MEEIRKVLVRELIEIIQDNKPIPDGYVELLNLLIKIG